jgi:signal transduction histidine kinase
MVLGSATGGLWEVFAHEGNRLLSVTALLHDTEHYLTAEERRREEQVHDVRSAVAALRAATLTLETYGGRLEEDRRSELRSAIVDELGRLQHLVEAGGDKPVVEFGVAQALAPVIAAERENGLVIDAQLTAAPARGRPEDLATVVQHLLVNARRHAGGSDVVVRSWRSGPDLHVSVEDRGPGVPVAEREAVFARGVRGAASWTTPGSGLGLYVARRLMTEQAGSIEIHDRHGGGTTFLLTLPAARGERPPAAVGPLAGVPELVGGGRAR